MEISCFPVWYSPFLTHFNRIHQLWYKVLTVITEIQKVLKSLIASNKRAVIDLEIDNPGCRFTFAIYYYTKVESQSEANWNICASTLFFILQLSFHEELLSSLDYFPFVCSNSFSSEICVVLEWNKVELFITRYFLIYCTKLLFKSFSC